MNRNIIKLKLKTKTKENSEDADVLHTLKNLAPSSTYNLQLMQLLMELGSQHRKKNKRKLLAHDKHCDRSVKRI